MNRYATNTLLAVTTSLMLFVGCEKTQTNEDGSQRVMGEMDAQVRKAVSRSELIAALESKDYDLTISVMNRVKTTHYKGDLIPLLKNIWAGNLVDTPQIDKEFVENPRIRLEIADVLLQASRNDMEFYLEPKAYNEYARLFVRSADEDVAIEAITVLYIANNPADFPLLQKILTEENSATYRIAVIAFTNNPAVTQADVERVAATLKRPEIREFLNSEWANMRK